MINLAFAFNFNIQRCEIEVGDEKQIVRRGYDPLIDLLIKNNTQADFFISGYSTRLMQKNTPDTVDKIKENIGMHFHLGTYTYSHPIPQLLKPIEFEKQLERGLVIDEDVYGIRPDGFLPPEFAYSREMAQVLVNHGIKWVISLASQVRKAAVPEIPEELLYFPFTAVVDDRRKIISIPAAYQLPENPPRFLKLMMKGQNPVDQVIEGVKVFARQHPDSLLLFKRDAETIFIDEFNSGFTETERVFSEFLEKLAALDEVRFSSIGDFIENNPPQREIQLNDYLGNTKVETFTEGEARPIWEKTVAVRDKLVFLSEQGVETPQLRKIWDHLLESHNSDGRIGYWFSEWNPGEHSVAPSRRQFISDNLDEALAMLEEMEVRG